jgi:site-specific DNA recombinase
MKRCFGYVRVSTVKQGDGVSLDAQREAILAFAGRNNIEIVKWFEEKETAAKSGRPIFNQMVKELRNGKAHGLVIHKVDRSARNPADWVKIGELADAGIDIHFVTESLDFRSRGGRLTADIQAVIAADYIRNLREETIKGINGRLKQGLYPFRAPLGYLDNGGGKAKTPDPIRAPLVKRLFELYATRSYSFNTLLAEAHAMGLTGHKGHRLSMHGLETIMDNPFYCGIMRIKRGGMTYPGIHEPLISAKLFADVQDIKSGKAGPKVTRHNHLYRGLFRCGLCDALMIPERQKGTVYYRCQTKSCATKTVREEAIARAINGCLETARLSETDQQSARHQIERWAKGNTEEEVLQSLQLREANLKDRMDRLTDALIDRVIDQSAFLERRERLAIEELQIADERRQLTEKSKSAANILSLLELTKDLKKGHELANAPQKRQWVEMTCSNRRISGKDVYLEPSNWLVSLRELANFEQCDPRWSRDRTFYDLASVARHYFRDLPEE